MTTSERGVGKCAKGHLGSYGYPTRPEDPYPFCPNCGSPMVWVCPECSEPVPHEADELTSAHFCRFCGASYFDAEDMEEEPAAPAPPEPAD